MKKGIFLVMLLLLVLSAAGEGNDSNLHYRNSYVAINGGMGIPLGNFRSRVYSQGSLFNDNGYALSGEAITISTGFVLHNNLGIAGNLGYNTNGFDMFQFVKNTPGTSGSSNPSDQWHNFNLMGGIFLTFPADKVSFDVHFMVGADFISTPSVSYSLITNNATQETGNMEISKNTGVAFISGMGAGVRLHLAGHFCLKADADLYAAPFKINAGYKLTDASGAISSGTNSSSLDVLLLNVTAGIAYSF